MKRAFALGLATVLTLALVGCGDGASTAEETAGSATGSATGVALEGYDAMAVDGEHEKAALDALPALVASQKDADALADADWDAVDQTEPRLVAYIVRVDLGEQVSLFEVRADGIAHNLYGYHRAFDSGAIVWTTSAVEQSATTTPASAGETMATAAVEAAMRDAFPDDAFTVSIRGYRFAYVLAEGSPVLFEVGVEGDLISAGI